MQDFRSIVRWILENYPSAKKIVEVGVGRVPRVLRELRNRLPDCELVATEVREVPVPDGIKLVRDDITAPNSDVYRGADLLFSLRTPMELYPFLKETAMEVGSDLMVKPVSSEESPSWGKLVNYSGVAFYVLRT